MRGEGEGRHGSSGINAPAKVVGDDPLGEGAQVGRQLLAGPVLVHRQHMLVGKRLARTTGHNPTHGGWGMVRDQADEKYLWDKGSSTHVLMEILVHTLPRPVQPFPARLPLHSTPP